MKVYIDKIMGGRARDKDTGATLPAGFNTWAEYITELITNFHPLPDQFTTWNDFINWLTVNVPTLPAGFNSWADYINYLINNSENAKLTRLISGTVTWLQNLNFQVSPLVYEILGQHTESPEKLVVIPANVSADPMFAVIYADVFGNVGYILGTPATNPLIPIVDPATQLLITPVYIPAFGTAPGNITNEVIYNENIEWTTAKTEETGLTIDFNATTSPAAGTKHIKIDIADGSATPNFINAGLYTSTLTINHPLTVPTETDNFDILLTALSQYHKTDTTNNNQRKISWFNWQNLNSVKIKLVNLSDQSEIKLKPLNTFSTEIFSIPALNFSVQIPLNLVAITTTGTVLPGDYTMVIEGLTSYDQYYTQTTVQTFTPAVSKLTFTRAAGAINAAGGNIIFSVKSSIDWLTNTGLIFKLYNGTVKVGERIFLPGSFYGFNPALAEYQRISIPVSDFSPTDTQITKLVIAPLNTWPNNSTLLIDNIILQKGIQPPTPEFKVITDLSVSGDGTTENPVILVNDVDTPGGFKYFGTDINGVKGWHLLPFSGDNVFIVYNETELLAAYATAISFVGKSATIYIGATITMTANRSFIRAYGDANISFVGIGITQVIAVLNTTLQVNNVTFRNISFSTTGHYYFTVNGGYASLYNVRWVSEELYNADINLMKVNIRITGTISNGTGQIFIDGLYHASAIYTSINDGNIQPFIIENATAWESTYSCYINILRMEALKDFDRFSKVLIYATAWLKALVTGDLSWYYHADQVWPGSGLIRSGSILLKKGSIEDLRGDYIPVSQLTGILGTNAANKVVKMHFWQGTQAAYNAITPKDTNTIYYIEEDPQP